MSTTTQPTFTDSSGRQWTVRITFGSFTKLKAVGLDLHAIAKDESAGGLVQLFASQPWELASALWLLCEKQANELGITEEQFAELLDGPTVDGARFALVDAALFFIRPPGWQQLRDSLPGILRKLGEDYDRTVAAALVAPGAEVPDNAPMPAS